MKAGLRRLVLPAAIAAGALATLCIATDQEKDASPPATQRTGEPTARSSSDQPAGGSAHERSAVDVPAPAPETGAAAAPDETVAVAPAKLPADLGKDITRILGSCQHACEQLGLRFPTGSPRISIRYARNVLALDAKLQAELNRFDQMQSQILFRRFETAADVVQVAPSETGATLEARMREKYPGYPEGYLYVIADNRGAAWKVAGDPVLEGLQRDGDALHAEYAWSVRAGYLQHFTFQ